MAILTSNYISYDTTGHYYYLTETGLESLTDVDNGVWNNASKRLKTQGRLLYDMYTTSAYNQDKARYRPKDIIEFKVFQNLYGEAEAIKNALITFAELSEYNQLDLAIRSGEAQWPSTITNVLYNAGIIMRGKIDGYVEEDDYHNGY